MRSETPDLNGVAATPPVGRDVIISPPPGTSRSLHGYLTLADVQAAVPGILVIHEIFGLNDHIRDVAARFSREGYAALAVDLFAGSPRPLCFLRIFYGLLVRPLANGTVAELQGALQYLRDRPEVDADRVGVIGFCIWRRVCPPARVRGRRYQGGSDLLRPEPPSAGCSGESLPNCGELP